MQLGTETDLCMDFCEREKSPPLTKEKISVPDLSLVFVMVSLKWPLQTAENKCSISEHVHCLFLTFPERGYYYGEISAMATMQSTAARSADLKRHRLCLSGLGKDVSALTCKIQQ